MTKETRTALLIALGGLVVGLGLGLLIPTGGSSPDVVDAISDPDATVVEIRGERYVITPEAAETAGYIPKPSYRVLVKEDADKLAEGMTAREVQALFPEQPIIYATPDVQSLTNPYRTEQLAIAGLSADGQISLIFTDGRLTSWGWAQGMTDSIFGTAPNDIIKAVQEGVEGEWASAQHQW